MTLSTTDVDVRGIPQQAVRRETNVSPSGRWLSILGGGALVALGLSRGSVPGLALAALGGVLVKRGATGRSRMYRMLDEGSAGRGIWRRERAGGPMLALPKTATRIERSVTVARVRDEVYGFFRDIENVRRIVPGLERVGWLGERRAQWVGFGQQPWEAELIEDRPAELIAWRSIGPNRPIRALMIHFLPAPGGRGTEVKVFIDYEGPSGTLGRGVEKILGRDPEQHVRGALRRAKQLIEAGEIATIEGQPSCRQAR